MTAWGKFKTLPSPPGALVGSLSPTKLKYETLKSVEISSNVKNVKSRCAHVKPPIVKTFTQRFWFKSHMLSRDRLVVICFRFLADWKSNKRTYAQGVCLFWAQIRKIRCATYKTAGHVLCQIFNHDLSGWFAWKNWWSCSRQPSAISTIPCHWTLLRRRQQQTQWSWGTLVMI